MNKILTLLRFNKRQRFVIIVAFLSAGIFVSEFLSGLTLVVFALLLSVLTVYLLYLTIRNDIRDTFYYPIFVLPFFYTVSFSLFFPLLPARLLTRLIISSFYAFGLYSLFLTQNIFAVSAIRTINLERSARIVSFVITILVLFFLTNITFSLRFPFYLSPIVIFLLIFLLNFQSLWIFNPTRGAIPEIFKLSLLIALALMELSIILNLWPVNAPIYSIFLTGIFYAYSGLTHAWVEKRLFKGVLWEYIWVGFLAIIILLFFSKWGL